MMQQNDENLTITVAFPDGLRAVPAFWCPDHAMYAGMPGELELHPKHMTGWEFLEHRRISAPKLRWIATRVKPTVRAFNDPAHAYYGSVRRLFVVLSTLFADYPFDKLELAYRQEWADDWDTHLVEMLPDYGCSESSYHREMVQRFIIATDNQ